jgi:hypothetical protein
VNKKNKINWFLKQKWDYILDLMFNTFAHKTWLVSPKTVWGHFKHNKNKELQKVLHDSLKKLWFKRQIFQTVFKWQTAWIIKKLDKKSWFEEAHVRFYKDWAIDVELEQGRFGLHHWDGKRVFGKEYLIGLINDMPFSTDTKSSIIDMIEDKDFAAFCKRSLDNPRYRIYRYITRKSFWLLWLYMAISLTFKFF